jgi:dTDP-4-amino-4,6-dideoxygalactose transaminase
MKIPFNKPYMTGKELDYIRQAHENGHLAGDGMFTKKCQAWLEETIGCDKALLTHSCTAALEIAAILAEVGPGDEVIMPSFTFVSTANAFVLRGATPVFVDIRPDTLNIDETLIEAAITDKTRVIVVVHYAGVGCEMDTIMAIAAKHDLLVIEDAAQGIKSTYKGRPLGNIGHLAALSFHETKNVISGEGGALLINSPQFIQRAEIIREKGTNRSQFFRGQVDKYTWVDIGSSYLPSELIAAFLWAQMEEAEHITRRRLQLWDRYHRAFEAAEGAGKLGRPKVPAHCGHNAHMYYLLLSGLEERSEFIRFLNDRKINCVFHYIPLDSAPLAKQKYWEKSRLPVTQLTSDRLVRLPLWLGLEEFQNEVVQNVYEFMGAVQETDAL